VTTPLIQPFAALRPATGRAAEVIARPYDVITLAEARQQADGKPWSFLHVSRAEIDCPPRTDVHAPEVYRQAAAALARMRAEGVLIEEDRPCYYAYRMTRNALVQTGLAAAASVAAYEENRVRRHEHTRPDKELDRTRQIEAVGAHTGPVLTAHPADAPLASLLATATTGEPIAEADTVDGTRHQIWRIADAPAIAAITARFAAMPAIYIADGHHRSAAAARVARGRPDGSAGGRFLVVSFPADELCILDYNRIVRDLNGLSTAAFLDRIASACRVEASDAAVRPECAHRFGMFVGGRWYALALREIPAADADPVARLDVSLLHDRILAPILGIGDARTDPRIDFLGGGRGLGALETAVQSDGWAVAFSLFPTAFADVMRVADAGRVMPPKSTWFEPKLADGLLSLPLAAGG
jgi:uncharacterized protein (DUF1015 family)